VHCGYARHRGSSPPSIWAVRGQSLDLWSASLSLHTRQKWRLWRSLHAGHALQWGPSPADGAAATAMPSPSKLPLSSPAMLPNTEPPPPKAMVNMPDGGPAGCVDAPPDACEALAAFSAALFASAVAAALAMMEAASERPRPELVPRAWREVYAMLTGNRGYVRGKGFQVGSKAAHGSRNRVQTEHQLSHSHTKLLLALSHEPCPKRCTVAEVLLMRDSHWRAFWMQIFEIVQVLTSDHRDIGMPSCGENVLRSGDDCPSNRACARNVKNTRDHAFPDSQHVVTCPSVVFLALLAAHRL